MVEGTKKTVTEDEAEVYDRQIRLWGLEAQNRLRSAAVLVIGIRGLGAEICKNIVLAGIKTITLLDHNAVTEEDQANFLIPGNQIGKSRAEASQKRLQELNPTVKVLADNEHVDDKPASFFEQFNVVCATGCTMDRLVHINQICREKNVKFFCGDTFGSCGYMFADLLEHEFAEEVTIHKHRTPLKPTHRGPPAKVPKVEIIKMNRRRKFTYHSLKDTLDIDWKSEKHAKLVKKVDRCYFLMRVLLKFRTDSGRDPDLTNAVNDISELKKIRDELLPAIGIPTSKVPDELLSEMFGDIGPYCAILGGVIAQEIIKTVSQKEVPHYNTFFFDPLKCVGQIEPIVPDPTVDYSQTVL